MAYLKPPKIIKWFNRMVMKFGMLGGITLVVPRRKGGELQKVPILPVDYEGARYLVSARGESEWVRNLRASGAGELIVRGVSRPFKSRELPVDERPPMIAIFRKDYKKMVEGFFKSLPEPADHPVFHLDFGDAG